MSCLVRKRIAHPRTRPHPPDAIHCHDCDSRGLGLRNAAHDARPRGRPPAPPPPPRCAEPKPSRQPSRRPAEPPKCEERAGVAVSQARLWHGLWRTPYTVPRCGCGPGARPPSALPPAVVSPRTTRSRVRGEPHEGRERESAHGRRGKREKETTVLFPSPSTHVDVRSLSSCVTLRFHCCVLLARARHARRRTRHARASSRQT